MLENPGLLAALIAAGYVLGSIPFGLLLTRLAGLGDVRKIGSGNIGATNVLRTGRKGLAAATLALDIAKGAAAVLAAKAVATDAIAAIAGLAAFLGHIYPVWLRFKGGKGVATAMGVLLGVNWPTALGCAAIWLGVALSFRISSLAALIACAAAPFLAWWFGATQMLPVIIAMVALVYWTHRANIARLRRGTEPRIGAK